MLQYIQILQYKNMNIIIYDISVANVIHRYLASCQHVIIIIDNESDFAQFL